MSKEHLTPGAEAFQRTFGDPSSECLSARVHELNNKNLEDADRILNLRRQIRALGEIPSFSKCFIRENDQ